MEAHGTRVAVQGFGNVGGNVARILHHWGYTVVAVSDVNGAILDPKGLDISALRHHKNKTGSVVGFPGANGHHECRTPCHRLRRPDPGGPFEPARREQCARREGKDRP